MTRLTSPQRDSRKKYAILLAIAASIFFGGIVWGDNAQADYSGSLTPSVVAIVPSSFVSPGFDFTVIVTNFAPSVGWHGEVDVWISDPMGSGSGLGTSYRTDAGEAVESGGLACTPTTNPTSEDATDYSCHWDTTGITLIEGLYRVNVEAYSWQDVGSETTDTGTIFYSVEYPTPPPPPESDANASQRQISWLIGIVTFGITLPIWRSIFRG